MCSNELSITKTRKKKTYDRIEETVKTSVFCVIRATKTFRFVDETSARFQAHIFCDVHTRTRTRRPHGVRDYEKMKEREREREELTPTGRNFIKMKLLVDIDVDFTKRAFYPFPSAVKKEKANERYRNKNLYRIMINRHDTP